MSSKCSTTGQNCCHPFVSLLSRVFTYELRVSPRGIHATIPLFHWFCSCFMVVHVFSQCDIRILVFSQEKRKLFLLFSVVFCGLYRWNSCENLVWFLRKSRVILVCFLWNSCENLVYARELPWGNTGRQRSQEIAFGILKLTMGCPANPCVATVSWHYFW